ncbi:hypothetical protein [Haloarcula halophila]|uniref:hypothetical protein n=1 Tax=Haloarcula TaxID=2237 RepID=UPI0023E441D9|nr:hypothetical protein [Halomicroarcula sp. DFY41]
MSTARQQRVSRTTRHGMVSLTAGFIAGVTLFLLIGAGVNDAVISALSLATIATISRLLSL